MTQKISPSWRRPSWACGHNRGRQKNAAKAAFLLSVWGKDPSPAAYTRPSACTFQASHSLRSGVRLVRWCST